MIDFRFQAKWQPETLSFNQFISILNSIPNIQHLSCTLKSETCQEKLTSLDYINVEKWRSLYAEFHDLINLDCSIKCPLKSSSCSEIDFVRIIANVTRASDRSIDINLFYNNETTNHIKSDVSTFRIISSMIIIVLFFSF